MFLQSLPSAPCLPRLRPLQVTALYLLASLLPLQLANWWIQSQVQLQHRQAALVVSELAFLLCTGALLFTLLRAMVCRLRDAIHAARASEAAAQRTADHLRQLLRMLPEAMLISQDGVLVQANRAAVELFGAPDEAALLGRPVLDCLAPQYRDAAQHRMHEALAQGLRDVAFLPRTMIRLDGVTIEAAEGLSVAHWHDRPAVLHIVRDMGHLLRAQRAAERAGEEMAALSHRLMDAQERERRSIARELHDEIGQCLSAIRVQFAKLQRRSTAPEMNELLGAAGQLTERTLGRVRSLSLMLHPPQLETLGLEAALRWHIGELRQLHDLPMDLLAAALPAQMHPDLAIAAYRIVQESLSNALRHGRPQRVAVHVTGTPSALQVEVVDDGGGFHPERVRQRSTEHPSLGLLGMKERARLLGGEFIVDSLPGAGTRVAAVLPWK